MTHFDLGKSHKAICGFYNYINKDEKDFNKKNR